VEPGKKEIDPQECKEHGSKTYNRKDSGPSPLPPNSHPSVENGGVDEPGDEGPCLLGIPAPVGAPGILGPDSAGDDAQSEEGKAQGEESVVEVVQLAEGGELLEETSQLLFSNVAFLDEIDEAHHKGQGKCPFSQKRCGSVDVKPCAL